MFDNRRYRNSNFFLLLILTLLSSDVAFACEEDEPCDAPLLLKLLSSNVVPIHNPNIDPVEVLVNFGGASLAVPEGNSGETGIVIDLSLPVASEGHVWVRWETRPGTADGEDFQVTAGTVHFGPGETNKSIRLTILGDQQYADNEADESFELRLLDAVNGLLPASSLNITIQNDDMTKEEAYLQLWDLFFDDWFNPPPHIVPPRGLDGKGMEIDLDDDGDLDVVYAKSGIPWDVTWVDEPLVVYRNHLGQGFTKEVIDVIGHHRDYVVTDVNSDGLQDLVLAVFGLDTEPFPGAQDRVLLQTQEGGLIDATASSWPERVDTSHGVCGGDFDGDGDTDIMMVPQLSLMMMNDDGTFTEERETRLPLLEIDGRAYQLANNFEFLPTLWELSAFWCATGDVDLDGDIDLILGDHSTTTATDAYLNVVGQSHVMLFNDGTGHFGYNFATSLIPNSHIAEQQATVGMQFLDVNGDDCGDLATVTTDYGTGNHVNVFINDCFGNFDLTMNDVIPGDWTFFIDPFDINGDGHIDLLTTYDRPYINRLDDGPTSRAYINDGEGKFTPRQFTLEDLYLGSPLMYLNIRPSVLYNYE